MYTAECHFEINPDVTLIHLYMCKKSVHPYREYVTIIKTNL